ncbi:MAG: hypothetical protein ACLFUJ_02800 [Phycisphaerae bacterium]
MLSGQIRKDFAMLQAGFDQIDITCGPDNSLIGYEFRQQKLPPGNAGVHDPLSARCLVLDDGETRCVLISLDLCILSSDYARQLRHAAAEAAETDAGRVIVACTHTHSGPLPATQEDVEKRGGFLTRFTGPDGRNPDQQYAETLLEKVSASAAAAAGLLCPVRASFQQAPVGLAYNRRVVRQGQVEHCWNPQESPELSPGPAVDPTCGVLLLEQVVGRRSVLVFSLGAHPVVLGKTSRVVSADWPGQACRLLGQYRPDVRAMFLQGPSGDAHPWVATQEDPARIEPVARAAAGMVGLLAEAVRPLGEDIELSTAVESWSCGQHELDLAVWRIGPVYLVAAPVELFGALAIDLRGRLDGPVLLATIANGWTGYWPTVEAIGQGGYEVDAAKAMGRDTADTQELIDRLAALAGRVG